MSTSVKMPPFKMNISNLLIFPVSKVVLYTEYIWGIQFKIYFFIHDVREVEHIPVLDSSRPISSSYFEERRWWNFRENLEWLQIITKSSAIWSVEKHWGVWFRTTSKQFCSFIVFFNIKRLHIKFVKLINYGKCTIMHELKLVSR